MIESPFDDREIQLLIDFHKDALRQGPGSSAETLLALDFVGLKSLGRIKIADIGSGSGAQTITLAQNTKSHIIAVDLFPEFLSQLNNRALELGLEKQIETCVSPMESLPFKEESFDLFWSEGAIYSMGFEEGIKAWRPFLKKRGWLVVSEISWLTDSRPVELEQHWEKEYPQIDTISAKIRLLEKNGYSPIAHFTLSDRAWKENYYSPMEERFPLFLEKYKGDELAKAIVDNEKREISLYETFKNYYGYVFYIAQKGLS